MGNKARVLRVTDTHHHNRRNISWTRIVSLERQKTPAAGQESFGRVTGDAETEAMGITNQVAGKAQDLYGKAADNASEMAGAVRNGASSLETMLRNFIENQPYTAVAIAAGLGWLFGSTPGHCSSLKPDCRDARESFAVFWTFCANGERRTVSWRTTITWTAARASSESGTVRRLKRSPEVSRSRARATREEANAANEVLRAANESCGPSTANSNGSSKSDFPRSQRFAENFGSGNRLRYSVSRFRSAAQTVHGASTDLFSITRPTRGG